MIGGIDPVGINDNTGPDIDLFMNDLSFVNGGITNESPLLIVDLFDENGINSSGSGIGHDLVAILDSESGNPIVLAARSLRSGCHPRALSRRPRHRQKTVTGARV